MALCVALQADGTLIPTGEAVEACSGYVLVTGTEHSFFALVNAAFSQPTPEEAAQWLVAPFGAILLCFVIGRLAGQVATVFK